MATLPDDEVDVVTTPTSDVDSASFEATVRVVVPLVFGLVTVVGLVGNLLVIAVALRHTTRNTTGVLIVGLAVADSPRVAPVHSSPSPTHQPLSVVARRSSLCTVEGLAVADLVFIVVCVPFTAVIYVLPVWPFGTVFCKVCHFRRRCIVVAVHAGKRGRVVSRYASHC